MLFWRNISHSFNISSETPKIKVMVWTCVVTSAILITALGPCGKSFRQGWAGEVLRSEPCLFASHLKLCRLSHLSWMFSLFVWLQFWPWHRQSSPAWTLCCASWESKVSVCCGSAKLSSAFMALEALTLLVKTQVDTWTPLIGRNGIVILKFEYIWLYECDLKVQCNFSGNYLFSDLAKRAISVRQDALT